MTLDQAPTGSSSRRRWVDPPADERARLSGPPARHRLDRSC